MARMTRPFVWAEELIKHLSEFSSESVGHRAQSLEMVIVWLSTTDELQTARSRVTFIYTQRKRIVEINKYL